MANKELNTRFLELMGFEGEELDAIMPEWEYTENALGLTDEDIRFSVEEWIPAKWDVQYKGVRLMLGAWLRELIEVAKTPLYKKQGKKIIYGVLPAVLTPYMAFKRAAGDNVYVSFPDLLLVKLLNGFFGKADPLINKAEELGFSYGCRHCPLNKTRLGAYATGVIASPDVIWSWGFNCDEGPKTDEYIQCLIGEDWKYVISRLPHDTYFGEADDEHDRIAYLAKVIKHDIDKVSEITGIYPTKEDFKGALADAGRYQFKLGQLTSLVCGADPIPLGGADLVMCQDGTGVPMNNGYKYLEHAIDVLIKELREEVKAGRGVLPKGAPKVGCYFVPYSLPWIDKLFRENGVALTFSQTLSPSKSQLKPTRYADDPYMGIAEQWLKMPLGQNMGYEVQSMVEKVQMNKPDGMIMGFFDFDRWLGAHQKMCASLVEKETGVPHYYIESDFWDDREYSEEALRTRIESICQILHTRKENMM